MRPRGLSSSSPRRTYVGQVAVQNPQWVQVRSTFSDCATSGSASCSGVKSVRTASKTVDHAAGIENAARIEALFDTTDERCQSRQLWFENRDRTAQLRRTLNQSGVSGAAPVRSADRVSDHRRATGLASRDRPPDKPARPIQIPTGIETARDRLAQLAPSAGCDRDAPDGAVSGPGERQDIANRLPEGDGRFVVERGGFTIRSQFGQEPLATECN